MVDKVIRLLRKRGGGVAQAPSLVRGFFFMDIPVLRVSRPLVV